MIYTIGIDTLLPNTEFAQCNIQDVVNYCEIQKVLGVDTETEGFDFTCKKMIMFQIGDEDNQFIIDTRFVSIEPLRHILESKNIIKIFHNAKFDYKFIKATSNIELECVYDTFLTERVINCGKDGMKYGLKDVCQTYLGVELNKDVRNQFIGLTGQPFKSDQIIYGAKDVEYLCQVREHQLPIIDKHKLQNVVDLENEAVLAFADIEYNGLDLDTEQWKTLDAINADKANVLAINLDQELIEHTDLDKFVHKYIQADMFTPIDKLRKVNVKWTSPKQVLEVFQTIIPKLDNVNGKAMYKYRFKHSIINTYVEYKEAMKLCTSYGDAFFKNLSSDNKIHTNFHQILDTGRVSSSKPNMQQIPADNRFRNCFIAPDGWSFVSSDYSSQELNVIAFGSKDPVWIKALEKGQDLHSTCAELVYGDDWINAAENDCAYVFTKMKCKCSKHKKLRTNVKTINFGLAYGMGPHKLADTLNIELEAAKILIDKYFEAFPSIKGFLDKLGNFGKKYGYIKTFPPYNRKRWFTGWYPKIWNNKSSLMELGSIERASKNTPIQGASADMTKKALIMMRNYIKVTNKFYKEPPVKLVMTVHDQIDTICRNDYLDIWTASMKRLMEEAALEIVTNGLLKAEVTVSNCWEK
jgi:DNA polymerase I-like protein with 3'-5' exonuclease and polymerase domains